MTNKTLLYRQVHPTFIQGGVVSERVFDSRTFKPFPKDDGLLSVYNGEDFSAEESFNHYLTFNSEKEVQSAGVVAVSGAECTQHDLPIIEDNDPFIGHASISYRGLTGNQSDKAAKKLKRYATDRGWCFLPDA